LVETIPELQPLKPATTASAALHMLRSATAIQHKALEARLPLTHPGLHRVTYQRILEAYYGFHAPLQALINAFHADPERQKLPALLKDLRALGLTDAQIAALPQCRDLPQIDSQARLLGVMYVMEGATLGGQVLRRIIAERLAIDADNGGEFLDVYGRDTGRLWKAFLSRLAEFDHPQHNPQIVDAACATFACFTQWLDHNGVLQ
jgi:heme oxygenase (biliverdin-IX-beta and delta-forming)